MGQPTDMKLNTTIH